MKWNLGYVVYLVLGIFLGAFLFHVFITLDKEVVSKDFLKQSEDCIFKSKTGSFVQISDYIYENDTIMYKMYNENVSLLSYIDNSTKYKGYFDLKYQDLMLNTVYGITYVPYRNITYLYVDERKSNKFTSYEFKMVKKNVYEVRDYNLYLLENFTYTMEMD